MIKKPTLLFVEEVENTLSRRITSNNAINVVLLRFKQNISFSEVYLKDTSHVPSFILDKKQTLESEIERFNEFCTKNNLIIDYFYNDSEYNQELVQKFASTLKLPGSLSEKQALCVRDKAVMKDMLNRVGYKTMRYSELSSYESVLDFAEKNGGFPIIVKWRKGLSSKEVYKIENADQLKGLNLDYSTGRFIAETFCPYLIWCIDSLVQDGKIVGTFFTWLPYTNLSFAEKKEKFAQITVNASPEEIKFDGNKVIQDIVDELELENGYMHLEAFVDLGGQPIICEFAWRTPGEHMLLNHSLAFGIDVYSLLIEIIVGKKIHSVNAKGIRCVGDMFLPLNTGEISKITPFNELKSLAGVIDGQIYYKVGDIIKSKRQYTDCSGWVQIEGDTKEEVLDRMLSVYKKFIIETL